MMIIQHIYVCIWQFGLVHILKPYTFKSELRRVVRCLVLIHIYCLDQENDGKLQRWGHLTWCSRGLKGHRGEKPSAFNMNYILNNSLSFSLLFDVQVIKIWIWIWITLSSKIREVPTSQKGWIFGRKRLWLKLLIIWSWNLASLSSCHPAILSSCHLVMMLFCHFVILSFCHLVILAAFQFVSLPIC